jgi:hypothetical protein
VNPSRNTHQPSGKELDVKHRIAALSLVLAALVLPATPPASAQAQKPAAPDLNAIPAAERNAMSACVRGVLNRLQPERPTIRAIKAAVGQDCDAQLRAVLAAAIRVGQAGPCKTVEGCIEQARDRAGNEAAVDYQRRR